MSLELASSTTHRFDELGLAVIKTELQAISALLQRVNSDFNRACDFLFQCHGRIVVMGMGKSGHIARKIAATLASTGSPAFYLHPAEASHGDFGMITSKDVVIAISNSGKTPEILTLLPLIKRLSIPMISLTGNCQSAIAEAANVNIDVSVEKEACPLGLAPTASTTCALVMGDALAIALLHARGFTEEDFAFSHPGGTLGRRLLLSIKDIMRVEKAIPRVKCDTKLSHALVEVSQKGLGMTTVVDDANKLLGIFTDGDLRRAMDKGVDVHAIKISNCMTKNVKTITANTLAIEALNIMENYKITSLIVVDENKIIIGAVHIHDLLRAGVK